MEVIKLHKKNTKNEMIFDGHLELLSKKVFTYHLDDETIMIHSSDFENNYLSTFSLFSKSLLLDHFCLNDKEKEFLYHEIVEKLDLKSYIPEYNNLNRLKSYYVKTMDFAPCFTLKKINSKYILFCFGVSELNPGRYVILSQGILEIIN